MLLKDSEWEGSRAIMKCWHFLVVVSWEKIKIDLWSLEYVNSHQRQKYNALTTEFS